jgi:hypothetical protein
VDANAVANFKTAGVALQLLFFDRVDNAVHKFCWWPAFAEAG